MGIQAVSSSTAAIDQATLAQSQSTSTATSASKVSQIGQQKVQGAPPPKGGGAKPASASISSSSSSSSTKIYDKRDTNKDGMVSYQEAQLYELKHPTEESNTQSKTTGSPAQQQTGLNAYKKDQQSAGSTTSTILTAA